MIDCYHGVAVVFQQAGGGVRCSKCGTGWADRAAYFADMASRSETPESIVQWCKDTFPQYQSREMLAIAILEEAIELAVAVGVPKSEIALQCLDGTRKPVSEPFPGEVADLGINLLSFAAHEGIDLSQAMNDKMKKNRERFK